MRVVREGKIALITMDFCSLCSHRGEPTDNKYDTPYNIDVCSITNKKVGRCDTCENFMIDRNISRKVRHSSKNDINYYKFIEYYCLTETETEEIDIMSRKLDNELL